MQCDVRAVHVRHDIEQAINADTQLLVAMWANNETGVLNPVVQLGGLCRERGIFFVCDATQAVGKIPVDIQAANVDALALSGHKFYGPKGVGALVAGRRFRSTLYPTQTGDGQERGLRSGTENEAMSCSRWAFERTSRSRQSA